MYVCLLLCFVFYCVFSSLQRFAGEILELASVTSNMTAQPVTASTFSVSCVIVLVLYSSY